MKFVEFPASDFLGPRTSLGFHRAGKNQENYRKSQEFQDLNSGYFQLASLLRGPPWLLCHSRGFAFAARDPRNSARSRVLGGPRTSQEAAIQAGNSRYSIPGITRNYYELLRFYYAFTTILQGNWGPRRSQNIPGGRRKSQDLPGSNVEALKHSKVRVTRICKIVLGFVS